LSMEEGRKIQRITRTARDPVKLRRAIVVLMSAQGQAVRDITSLLQVGEDYVRDVIHGEVRGLGPGQSGRRPRGIGDQLRERVCLIARTSPADWGITEFATWSVAKLRDHLVGRCAVVAISLETLRRILRVGGVCPGRPPQHGRPPDPEFIPRMHRNTTSLTPAGIPW
ncbi:MAG TPA: helix-turn-helix domain-containing protein, partial [Mycobacteriales bacterium]